MTTTTDTTCSACGGDSLDYVCSDRHRGYYDCATCGTRNTVDYYA